MTFGWHGPLKWRVSAGCRARGATPPSAITRTGIAGLLVTLLSAGPAGAQELEPRAYSPSPVGTTFLGVTATRSAGGVFTEASLPITNVEATVGMLGLAVGRTFSLYGKQMLLLGILPITWGEATGEVGEVSRSASRRGVADPRARLSVILAGSPAMSPADFARAPRRTILGASITVAVPAGEYDGSKLVNLGANRWAFKPEIGLSYPAGRWTLDAYGGVWFFTANNIFYPGSVRRTQDPVITLQGHVSYTLWRRAWLAVNATWYSGGQTNINGAENDDSLRNTRLGATWAVPMGARHSFKVSYSAGAATRIGADFKTITAAWQMVWY